MIWLNELLELKAVIVGLWMLCNTAWVDCAAKQQQKRLCTVEEPL